jgi:hypothetical protein
LADDLEESDAGLDEGPAFPLDDRRSATEASDLEARARDFVVASRRGYHHEGDVVPQHLLVPTDRDPGLWAVRVKVSHHHVHEYYLTLSSSGTSLVSYLRSSAGA